MEAVIETKESLLERLEWLISGGTIKAHVDSIHRIRLQLNTILNNHEKEIVASRIKSAVQAEANAAIDRNGGNGLVVMATGTGKSKVLVDRAAQIVVEKPDAKILIATPTEILRDVHWKNEFEKWGKYDIWMDNVETVCYASLHNIVGKEYDLYGMDEAHNITKENSIVFEKNTIKNVVGLTASIPDSKLKVILLAKYVSVGEAGRGRRPQLTICYEITMDEAVKLGLVAPYEVTIITMPLDSVNRTIKAGSKARPFYVTEQRQYEYLTRLYVAEPNRKNALRRARFISNLPSKTRAAQQVAKMILPELKTLIFCGSKDQANKMCAYRYCSKPTKPKKLRGEFNSIPEFENSAVEKLQEYIEYEEKLKEWQGDVSLNKFKNDEILRLSCVNALNEGHDIAMMDCGFIVQVNAATLRFIQRTGRAVRYRPGYTAQIIILCAKDTVDEEWAIGATAGVEGEVRTVELAKLLTGEERINFN